MIKYLELNDLNKIDREAVVDLMWIELNKQYLEMDVTIYVDFTLENKDISVEYKTEFIDEELEEIIEWSIVEYDYSKLFEGKGIKYEESRSGSVYFNHNGKDYRISDHDRPNYEVSGVWYEHNYENDLRYETADQKYNIIKNIIK